MKVIDSGRQSGNSGLVHRKYNKSSIEPINPNKMNERLGRRNPFRSHSKPLGTQFQPILGPSEATQPTTSKCHARRENAENFAGNKRTCQPAENKQSDQINEPVPDPNEPVRKYNEPVLEYNEPVLE